MNNIGLIIMIPRAQRAAIGHLHPHQPRFIALRGIGNPFQLRKCLRQLPTKCLNCWRRGWLAKHCNLPGTTSSKQVSAKSQRLGMMQATLPCLFLVLDGDNHTPSASTFASFQSKPLKTQSTRLLPTNTCIKKAKICKNYKIYKPF